MPVLVVIVLYNLDCAHGLYCILNTLTVTTKQSFFYYLCSKSFFQRTVIFKKFFKEAEVLLLNGNFRVLIATALFEEKVILFHSTITKGTFEQINGFYSKKHKIICWVETKDGKFHPSISSLKENYVYLIFQASSAVTLVRISFKIGNSCKIYTEKCWFAFFLNYRWIKAGQGAFVW